MKNSSETFIEFKNNLGYSEIMIRDEIKKLITKAIEKEFGKIEIPEIEIEEIDRKKVAVIRIKEFPIKPVSSKGRCLKLVLWSKNVAEYFINLGITPQKTYSTHIPTAFLQWSKSKHVIRGIFETDGSLYFSYSKSHSVYPTYPRLEIKTVSKKLSEQLIFLLSEQGFMVCSRKTQTTYCVYLSGEVMLHKWIQEIGFSNERTKTKYLFWKKYGYYIPKMKQQERLERLGSDCQILS